MSGETNANSRLLLIGVLRRPRLRPSIAVLAACGVLVCSTALAQRVAPGALPSGPAGMPGVVGAPALRGPEVISGSFGAYTVNGNVGTIRQNDPAGILHWASFDIGRDAKMVFQQPSASSVVLNRVDGGAYLNQTVIEGMLQANGQVYIYNPNGVIIGRGAQIDVGGLLASALNIENARFLKGLLSPSSGVEAQLRLDAAYKNHPGAILVEAGSSVIARDGGRILLIAPEVSNAGSLVSENGQVILAAGRQVFLTSSSDSNMRGLLVEVNNANPGSQEQTATSTVRNSGTISVGEGNATLVGYAVNQMGTVSATTTIDNNGSIWLLARDGATLNNNVATPSRGGELTLGSGSVNQILLAEKSETDSSGKTVTRTLADSDRRLDKVSQVLLSGEQIRIEDQARISARAGKVDIRAQGNPGNFDVSSGAPLRDVASTAASVEISSGASIDVSGASGTELPMESLSMAVELRGSQLADSPLLRNSALRGQTVYVDVRKGTSIANISGDLALRTATLGELAARGGEVSIYADGAVKFSSGARIDVSGGWVDYLAGRVPTSKLVMPSGRLVDISNARKDVVYLGVLNGFSSAGRGREAGYRQGYSAGKLTFNGASLVLAGELSGKVVRGPNQRDPGAADWPAGASLIIGDVAKAFSTTSPYDPLLPSAVGGDASEYGFRGSVVLGKKGQDDDDPEHLNIDPTALAAAGFEHFRIAAGGSVGTAAAIALPTAASLEIAAFDKVELGHAISASGGTVKAAGAQVSVGDGVAIDLAGQWINDLPASRSRGSASRDEAARPTATIATAGGSLMLKGENGVSVGQAAEIDVSGGVHLSSAGKLSGGKAGSIALSTPTALPGEARGLSIAGNALFLGYGLNTGGTLKLQGRDAYLGGDSPFAGSSQVAGADARYDLWLGEEFFALGGFGQYEIGAAGNLTVRSGAQIAPLQRNWFLDRDYAQQASGSMDFAAKALLDLSGPVGSRQASKLTLTAKTENYARAGQVVMEAGSSIVTDPGGKVALKAGRLLDVEGTISTPAGSIDLQLSKATPSTSDSVGYLAERAIWIGENARLLAQGSTARMSVGARGVVSGEVLDGGMISIGGPDGDSAVGHVVVAAGAVLDVSGTAGRYALKNDPQHPVVVASDGGSIDIRARESLYFAGTAQGEAGAATAVGGSFNATLDRDSVSASPAGYPQGQLDLAVSAGTVALPGGLAAGDALDALAGHGRIAAGMLNAGGFDRISLKSQDSISLDFAGGSLLALNPTLALSLDAPLLVAANAAPGAKARLGADQVMLGSTDWRYQAAHTPQSGAATLAVTGTVVDLNGELALRGFDRVAIDAAEALRLSGVSSTDLSKGDSSKPTAVALKGALRLQGDLEITAGQVYPTTLSQYAILAEQPAGGTSSILIHGNGTMPQEPYSAAASLTLVADDIVQDGIVRAPLGELVFKATRALSFEPGSLTSVAATQTIPFGRVSNGREWIYDFGNGNYMTVGGDAAATNIALPSKRIVSEGKSVAFKPGARLDLSGGGDLAASEFLPGPGGSRDVLDNDGKTFAILPGYASNYAPVDPQNQVDSGLQAGARVWLAGGKGLAAGYYTLLPAQYALLPGAYSITLSSGGRDIKPTYGVKQADGSLLTAGRTVFGTAGLGDARWSSFRLASGSVVRQSTEYGEYRASSFFADKAKAAGEATPVLPADGGNLVVDVGSELLLKGDFLFGGSGRRGKLDVAADELVIVGKEGDATPAGAVKVSVADLLRTGAGSLLLGGRRAADGVVTVRAERVTLANDAESALVAPDVTLAAKNTVLIEANAVLRGSGATTAETLVLAGEGADADGALVRVTGQGLGEIVRSAPAGSDGVLEIGKGALVRGEGGVNLDATRSTVLAQAPEIGTGGGFAFGTGKIALGDAIPAGRYDVAFGTDALADFSQLGRLSLTSYGGFDLFGTVDLGAAGMSRLALYGAGLQGFDANVALQAKTVVLANAGRNDVQTVTAPGTASGSLVVRADSILFGSALARSASKEERKEAHDFGVAGFADTRLLAAAEVRGEGYGKGALRVADGTLQVVAPRITAAGGADATLAASNGSLTTRQSGSNTTALPVGGSLTLSAATISHGGTAVAASGSVRLEADGDVVLEDGSLLSAAGQTVSLGQQTAYTEGGQVDLLSRNGAVFLGTPGGSGNGATIDVSGHEVGGRLNVSALNTATQTVAGNDTTAGRLVWRDNVVLKGEAATTSAGFSLDAGSIGGFGVLNRLLNAAGFGASRDFRARSGDLNLADGESIVAHSITLAADQGDITLAGTLDARGEQGGTIKVYAAQATAGEGKGNVTLESSARLLASASQAASSTAGSAGDGGYVEIGTSTADGSMPTDKASGSLLTVKSGALIDVAGAGSGEGGRVVLRVPRIGSDEGQDVAIDGTLETLVSGAADKMIEAVKVYADVGEIKATTVASTADWYQETAKFVADNKAAILAGLSGDSFRLQPGLEIRAAAEMQVSVNEKAGSSQAANRGWNLDTWRFDGEPVSLTLRATDSLTLLGSISDGFVKPSGLKLAMPDWLLDTGSTHSASYRLVAAADFAAANPLAVVTREDESGDFRIDFARSPTTSSDLPVALLRTGTGNIDIAAGHDVVFASLEALSGETLAAQVYTAGRASATGSFTAPSLALNTGYGATSTNKATAQYAVDGGDIGIYAAHDVQGAATQQLFSEWLFRQGQTKVDSDGNTVFVGASPSKSGYATSWWVQYDRFNQNLATFAGGDLQVTAGSGDVANLSVAAATTAYVDGLPGTAVSERGGGDVVVQAGGDIRGGSFYAQKGKVALTAGGEIGFGDRVIEYTDVVSGETVSMNVLPVIALGDGTARVVARGDIALEGVLNPTLIPQSAANQASANANSYFSYFGSYADDSKVALFSSAGDITLRNSQNILRRLNRIDPEVPRAIDNLDNGLNLFYTYYPGSLSAIAFGGDIDILAGFSMAPSATGQLSLLAAGSVSVGGGRQGEDTSSIVMLDRDPALMPSTARPAGNESLPDESLLGVLGGMVQGLAAHTSGGLHAGDSEPVHVVAASGDIVGMGDVEYTLVAAKAADIQAAGDVRNFGLYAQHLAADQVSRISAGGSITAPTEIDGSSPVTFRIGGPGRFEMLAGKDIDFGNSQGLVSAGNADNPYLPAVSDYGSDTQYSSPRYGADLLLAAGLSQGLKAEEFLSSLAPAAMSKSLLAAAKAAVLDAGGGFASAEPSAKSIWTAFSALPAATRQAFYAAQASNINDNFFAAVIAQVNAEPKNLAAFDALLARYLGSANGGGDINVFGSQIKTLRRGNIDIFVPGGSLYAGVVSTPASLLAAKTPAEMGIFTISGGEIRILVGQDISVNQGRIFSLGGGDITLISQYQDIDAGRGAKTAASAPPPTLEFDAFGNARIDISSSVAGSGIRTLKTGPDVPVASIYAASPRGVFDAGDAGVGSSGEVKIVAASVLNANNISASNGVSGVPAVDTGALGASVTAPTSPNSRAEDAVRGAMGKEQGRGMTFLNVDVLGYGDGSEGGGEEDNRKKGRK